MVPRVVTSMLLACAFGACSEDEPRDTCVCKPVMKMETVEPIAPKLCNNATFQWMIQTLLEEISTLKQREEDTRKEILEAREQVSKVNQHLLHLQEAHDRCLDDAEMCHKSVIELEDTNHRLMVEQTTASVVQVARPPPAPKPQDCRDVLRRGSRYSGIYTIHPPGYEDGTDVFCDLDTDGGGWTVIQRRQDGTQSFQRSWESYKQGFGQIAREFWLGNDKISALTHHREYTLRIDMLDFSANHAYAQYDTFSLEDESQAYMLRLGKFTGNAGDALSHHANHRFSTLDVDNDLSRSGHCSRMYGGGGWWYVRCYDSNLNGVYYDDGDASHKDGMIWYQLQNSHTPLLHVEMKIRPKEFLGEH